MILSKVLKKIHLYLKYVILDTFANSHICPIVVRRHIYNCAGHKITGVIHAECFLGYGPKGHLTLGKGSYCNFRCFFDLGDDISIGENCSVAYGVTFCNSYHELGGPSQRAGQGKTGKIVVQDGCWIGTNVTIMPNVCIGNGCIIAASSVVTKNCDPNGLYAGVPARRIKDL